jgi:hypothetical protein
MTASVGVQPESHGEALPNQLLYLYAVLEPGSPAYTALQAGTVQGMEVGAPLFPVSAAGLVAAVSRVPSATFGEESLNALVTDLPRLAPYAVLHEQAIAQLLPDAPALVPMTFGAVYRSALRVQQLLEERAPHFRALLDRTRDKREWGIKLVQHLPEVVKAVETKSAALRELNEEIAAATPGRAYLLSRRLQQVIAAEANRLVEEACQSVLQRLGTVSEAVRRDALTANPADAAQLAFKASFLVTESQFRDFEDAAAQVAADLAPQGLELECSGPWAPYSFVGEQYGG